MKWRLSGYTFLKGLKILLILLAIASCKDISHLFVLIPPQESGIDFINRIELNDTINGVDFEYVYNGAGVAVGDVNNDGLNDLFFAGNMESSRLYLNLGGLKFRDISTEAGVITDRWCTGVSFADINNDGFTDIYICVAGLGAPETRKNIFFINQGLDDNGIPHYKDMAMEMGLADEGYSTMAVFFDYDKDQDLDMYLLTNAMEARMRNALRPRRINGEGPSTDRLYRNEGEGRFTDVSEPAGILQEGYGLGIGICDINQDGWTDVYCSNDFLSNDLLWVNNQDGTFSEQSAQYFKHFTSNGMGMDIADYNNDALIDVIVLDMLPMTNQRQKQMIGYRNLNRFYESIKMGYHPQYLRNTLQLNRGQFEDGKFRFSEIGYLAGMHQTDWSWSPLLADYDNDGWKDLSITNGYRKDVTNLDYIYFTLRQNTVFGTPDARKELAVRAMNDLPDVQLPNFIFKNNQDLTFSDRSYDWGLDVPTFTNGTAYSDLDNDGDLDIVINNIDQVAMLFRNTASDHKRHHYLSIRFDEKIRDYEKPGLKVWAYHQDNQQYYEYSPYRGYKSTVGPEVIIGLGLSPAVDSLMIQWPDGHVIRWHDLPADTTLYINKESGVKHEQHSLIPTFKTQNPDLRFEDITAELDLKVRHIENSRNDLDIIPIILHKLGQFGPGLAVGDINGDNLEDIYVGNDSKIPGYLLMQQKDQTFRQVPFPLDSVYEDMGALFFDADNDGDKDLYVVSGGSNWQENDPRYQDRLYLNDGSGEFNLASGALPPLTTSGSCVVAGDYDLDGDPDLFIGGRLTPNRYPASPQSYLLENQNGRFIDVSEKLGSSRGMLGMVTAALWTDTNGDGHPDLIIAGEYMPVTLLINTGKRFIDKTSDYGLENTSGWWNSINGADLDHDGDIDYIVGNYGLNSFFQPTPERPVEIYGNDYDKNGSFDPITTVYIEEESYIFHPRNLMIDQIPSFELRFRTFEKYSTTPFNRSFTEEEINSSVHLENRMMASVILENGEGNRFNIQPLPTKAQFSPVYGTAITDINNDGFPDLLLIGNSYDEETVYGYYDASYGTLLINKGDLRWEFAENNKINLLADGDKKALARIRTGNRDAYVITENNGPLQVLSTQKPAAGRLLEAGDDDWYALIEYKDGRKSKIEFYHGSGYLSQHSRKVQLNGEIRKVKIVKYTGETRIF